MSQPAIALIGNPNSGKSTLFNRLTGARQSIGNWPGVTVERVEGVFQQAGQHYTVVDLPGTYALADLDGQFSQDERIAQQAVQNRTADVYINVVDASNLGRHLFLTSQLLEMGVTMVIALNMMDVAERRQLQIDVEALARVSGCPVVPIKANTGAGIRELQAAAVEQCRFAGSGSTAQDHCYYDIHLHYGRVEEWLAAAVADGKADKTLGSRIDAVVLNRWLGFPIFLGVIYCMFLFAVKCRQRVYRPFRRHCRPVIRGSTPLLVVAMGGTARPDGIFNRWRRRRYAAGRQFYSHYWCYVSGLGVAGRLRLYGPRCFCDG